MSAISTVREYRDLGDSWRKALRAEQRAARVATA